MFKVDIRNLGRYLHVTGYADGSDWLFWVGFETTHANVGNGNRVWAYDGKSSFKIFDATSKSLIKVLELPDGEKTYGAMAVNSQDGTKVFVRTSFEVETSDQPEGQTFRRLHAISLEHCRVVNSSDHFRDIYGTPFVEVCNGTIRFPIHGDSSATGTGLFDPDTGSTSVDVLEMDGPGFFSVSPKGSYLLRPELSILPRTDVRAGPLGFLHIGEKIRYYGFGLQLWQTSPLRLLRRLFVAWKTSDDFKFRSFLNTRDSLEENQQVTSKVLDAVSDHCKRHNLSPTKALREFPPALGINPQHKLFSYWFHEVWNLEKLLVWEPDESAFWCAVNDSIVRVEITGEMSPRLNLKRLPDPPRSNLIYNDFVRKITPAGNKTAHVVYPEGIAILDGAPQRRPQCIVLVPKDFDGWHNPPSGDNKTLREIDQRIHAIEAERNTLTVKLSSLSQEDCIVAIKELAEFVAELPSSDENVRMFEATFEVQDEPLDEGAFFDHVRDNCPEAVVPLRDLISETIKLSERTNGKLAWRTSSLSKGERDMTAIFATAARALGVLDAKSVDLVRKYGDLVDEEHEYFYSLHTIPAVIEAHGWTREVIDLVVRMTLVGFRDSFESPEKIWYGLGLGKAVKSAGSPQDFADRLRRLSDGCSYTDFEALASNSVGPQGEWLE